MNYIYTTLALGKTYFDKACKFATDLNKISKNHKILIVTDCETVAIDNVTFINFDESETKYIQNVFNYNLKYIPILEGTKTNYDYVIYFDADWEIHTGYNETVLENFLNDLGKLNYDLIYERPHNIGDSKKNLNNCFWRHKIEPYKLLDTDFYDSGQVVNEQFLIFKNNDKLKIFSEKWKERNKFGVENNIWAFAEGVEIGMSTVDAQMQTDWKKLFELKSFFKFSNYCGDIYIRF